jgi:phosphopantetheine adenylyltransferase
VFVPAHAELSEVSSSRLKQLASEDANLAPYCSASVAERLRARFNLNSAEARHV